MTGPSAYYAPNKLAAAKPTRHIFDAWNSSSTGHQRAENRLSGSTGWRDSRNAKLAAQYSAGYTGGERMADQVGAGSEEFGHDGRLENGSYEKGASSLRKDGQQSLYDCMQPKTTKPSAMQDRPNADKVQKLDHAAAQDESMSKHTAESEKKIFRNLVFYVNGSTYPLISDHKLKHLIAEHGGNQSIALGRRSVTHVILGTPNGHAGKSGCGGGLSSSKMQKEIANLRGKGIKFVSVEWIIESVKAGIRLPEARFAEVKLAMKGQKSVYGMFENGKITK